MRLTLGLCTIVVIAGGCASAPKNAVVGPSEIKLPTRAFVDKKGDVVVEVEWVKLAAGDAIASHLPSRVPFESVKPDGSTVAGAIIWNRTDQPVDRLQMVVVRGVRLRADGSYNAEFDTHSCGPIVDVGPFPPGYFSSMSVPKTCPVYYGGELIPRRPIAGSVASR